ncbi:MAG: TolC family protein, partial [Bacteroidota bacterium]
IPVTVLPESFGDEFGSRTVKFGTHYTTVAGISATQLLFDGSYIAGLQASHTYEDLSVRKTSATKIETAVAVAKAYYGVLVGIERLALINQNVERLKKLRGDIKLTYETGLAEKLDFDRVDLTYNNLVVQQINTQRLVDLSYSLLKFQMGMDAQTKIELTDKLDLSRLENTALPDSADVTKRIEYSIWQTSHRLQELDLKRYKSAYYPSLVAFGNFSTSGYRDEFDFLDSKRSWYPATIIGFKLTVPIWDGLQRSNRVKQSKMELQKLEYEKENLVNAVDFEYSNSKTNLENNMALLETNKQTREIAAEIVRASQVKYNNGVGSSLDVMDAESALKEAETNYYSALYSAIVSKIELEKALGNLTY